MNRDQRVACIVTFGLILSLGAVAQTSPKIARWRTSENAVVLKLSDLRSAFLLRSGIVSYDLQANSPDEIRAQLQKHFDVVIGLLLASTPQSIETALDRLEVATDRDWSQRDRAARRQKLLAMRYLQLRRLAEYRDRGVFPINEGQARHPVPIFIDKHDTACAVGHLMRLSNKACEVASIRENNNFVCIPDITGGPVAQWVLASGLTIEEAALTQPAYGWIRGTPSIPDDAVNPLEPNWSAVVEDLRFSNFELIRDTGKMHTPPTNIPVAHCGSSFCYFWGSAWPTFPELQLNRDDLGPVEFSPATSIIKSRASNSSPFQNPMLIPDVDDFERVLIQFDIETVSPLQRLARLPFGTSLLVSPGEDPTYLRNSVSLFLSDDLSGLFFHDNENNSADLIRQSVKSHYDGSFLPVRKMTLVTEMLVLEGKPFEAQLLNFSVITIPEPNSIFLAMGIVLVGAGCRIKRRATLL